MGPPPRCLGPGGCFSNVSRALQNDLAKIYNASNHIYGENFKLKRCTCAQSMALGTRTKFQLEMLIGSAISATHKFRENILESSRNVSETTPWCPTKGWTPCPPENPSCQHRDGMNVAHALVPTMISHAGFASCPTLIILLWTVWSKTTLLTVQNSREAIENFLINNRVYYARQTRQIY